MASLSDRVEELAEALVVVAIVVGGIAAQIFIGTNTSGYSAVQLLAWGSVLTIAFAAIALGFIRHMRKGGR